MLKPHSKRPGPVLVPCHDLGNLNSWISSGNLGLRYDNRGPNVEWIKSPVAQVSLRYWMQGEANNLMRVSAGVMCGLVN